ncbi:branched-chain amino acid ABC transporter permease [Aquabacter sp. CN5-332]|uniref:branched-chain amino acid ABC transporter permease n=1 Tax=Aquabacter sp. CN5-332 TaxID=3156608 RepID=UPI0032B5B3EA
MSEITVPSPPARRTAPAPTRGSVSAAARAFGLAALLLLPLAGDEYWIKSVALPTLIFGLAALGLNLVVGVAGQISMGQAAFMAVGAFIGAIAYGRYGLPLPFAILAAGFASAAIGIVIGLPSRSIRGLYLMVSTLAAQFIVLWLLQRVPWFGAASHGILSIPKLALGPVAFNTPHARYLLTLAVVVPLTLFAANLVRSRIGRAWIGIREREIAAEVLGVPAFRYKLMAFAAAGFYAGVAGALVTFAWTGAATVEEFRLELSVKLLGMIIIGGLGSVLGSYLGAAFIVLVPIAISIALHAAAGLLGWSAVNAGTLANAEHLVFGLLIIAFLIAEPKGLAPLLLRGLDAVRNIIRPSFRRAGAGPQGEKE